MAFRALRDRNAGFSKSYLVNIPQNGVPARTWAYIPNNVTNLFCSGHTFLPDGRLFAMGGHVDLDYFGAGDINFFAETPSPGWETQPNAMNAGRWYPSVINLPNEEILVVSGTIAGSTNIDPMPQVWKTNEGGGFRDLTTALRTLKTYPKIFVAPNGRVVSVGSEQLTSYLDTSGTGKWSNGPRRAYGNRNYGAAVLYDDGKILIAGGATTNSAVPTATAEVLDLNAAKPAWRYTQPMANARKHCTATLLPDGTVLVTGGSSSQHSTTRPAPFLPPSSGTRRPRPGRSWPAPWYRGSTTPPPSSYPTAGSYPPAVAGRRPRTAASTTRMWRFSSRPTCFGGLGRRSRTCPPRQRSAASFPSPRRTLATHPP